MAARLIGVIVACALSATLATPLRAQVASPLVPPRIVLDVEAADPGEGGVEDPDLAVRPVVAAGAEEEPPVG